MLLCFLFITIIYAGPLSTLSDDTHPSTLVNVFQSLQNDSNTVHDGPISIIGNDSSKSTVNVVLLSVTTDNQDGHALDISKIGSLFQTILSSLSKHLTWEHPATDNSPTDNSHDHIQNDKVNSTENSIPIQFPQIFSSTKKTNSNHDVEEKNVKTISKYNQVALKPLKLIPIPKICKKECKVPSYSDMAQMILKLGSKHYQTYQNEENSVPFYTTDQGKSWFFPPRSSWVAGFSPGVLWGLYNGTKIQLFKTNAIQAQNKLIGKLIKNHDRGFAVVCSFANGLDFGELDLRETTVSKNQIVEGANVLVNRFIPQVGCIRSWDAM